MSSIVGPLVNPNKLEDHFDRTSLRTRIFRHPALGTLILLLAAGAAVAVKLGYIAI